MNTNLGTACSEAGEGVMLEAARGHVGAWLGSFSRHFLYPSIHALIHINVSSPSGIRVPKAEGKAPNRLGSPPRGADGSLMWTERPRESA